MQPARPDAQARPSADPADRPASRSTPHPPTSPLYFAGAQYATYPASVVPPEAEGLSGEGLLSYTPTQTPYVEEKGKAWVPELYPTREESSVMAWK